MSFKKQFLKSKPVCKVVFRVSISDVNQAKEVKLVGSFNHWDLNTAPMTALKSGDFTTTLELPVNQELEFRYLVDQSFWMNDMDSEGFVANTFGDYNSVIKTHV